MAQRTKFKQMLLGAGVGVMAAAGLLISTPASADNLGVGITPYGFSLHYNSSPYYGRHNYGRHNYGRYNYGYRTPYYGRRHHYRRQNNYYNNNRYNSYADDSSGYTGYANQGCQPVSKTGYWHGRQAKIGGTMCYDGYGNGYVVQGSRYLIHYY